MRVQLACGAIALVALFIRTPAQAADQVRFDLLCTMRLSVDLKAKRWCYRDAQCSMTFPVASVENDTIHLLAVKTDLNEASFDIVRSTGAYKRRFFTPQYSIPMLSTGICVVAPFTPIR
jgi:hypothetical protein